MKKLLLLTAIIAVVLFVAAKLPNDSKEGIVFFKGTWAEAVAKAQKENKPIFLDIYATWCGPCKMLKHSTFTDKSVGTFYNTNYINVTLDGEEGDGAQLASKLHISGYPSLIFLDKNGNPKLNSTGYVNANTFLSIGKDALKKLNNQ